jgi:SprT protein
MILDKRWSTLDPSAFIVHAGHMATQKWARDRTLELMREFGIIGWQMGFDNARQRAGQTNYDMRIVTLSRYFVQFNTPERIEQTIRHELAHVLAGHQAGHGPKWKAMCQVTGFHGERTYKAAETIMPSKPWSGRCGCGNTWERHRLTERTRRGVCPTCRESITWRRSR